ncbi:MAG: heavy metal-associated domain-containing protein [Planctomycetota bacterium]
MRRITLLFLLIGVTYAAGCATSPPSGSSAVAVIEARGMSCPQCAGSADRRLMMIDGVTWTRIDLGRGTVTVGLDPAKPTPDAEALRDAVRWAGFTAGSVTWMNDTEAGAAVR